jgi:hypothetical protein
MTKPRAPGTAIAVLLALLATGTTAAQTTSPVAGEDSAPAAGRRAGIDPFADQIIAAMAHYLGSAQRLRVEADIAVERMLDSGQKIELSHQVTLMLRRPDRLRVETLTDDGRRRFYYDGDTLSMQLMDNNVYAILDVGDNVDTMVDDVKARFDIPMPLADLLVSDVYENFASNVKRATYLGLHYLNGVRHHHLLLATYVNDPGMPRVTTRIASWQFDGRMPDLIFQFNPPADADEIQLLPADTASGRKEATQ